MMWIVIAVFVFLLGYFIYSDSRVRQSPPISDEELRAMCGQPPIKQIATYRIAEHAKRGEGITLSKQETAVLAQVLKSLEESESSGGKTAA